MKLLQDKVALITGGSRGIGAALVARFVEHGAHVAFTYRSSATEAEKVIADNAVSGITIKAYQSDASNFQAAETLVNTGLVVLAGEISTSARVNYTQIARDVIRNIGYDNNDFGFSADNVIEKLLPNVFEFFLRSTITSNIFPFKTVINFDCENFVCKCNPLKTFFFDFDKQPKIKFFFNNFFLKVSLKYPLVS